MIFIDLTKAFDVINHFFTPKLELYGFSESADSFFFFFLLIILI